LALGLLPLNGAQDSVTPPLNLGLKACGTAGSSIASNSTPAPIKADTNATLRASLSNLAIISLAPWTRHAARPSASLGILALAALNLSELGYNATGAAMYVHCHSRG
jgi:hypothetical protein